MSKRLAIAYSIHHDALRGDSSLQARARPHPCGSLLPSGRGAAQLLPSTLASQYWMLAAAGAKLEGAGAGLRVTGLAAIYAKVFRVWLDDASAGQGIHSTMALLDRKLRTGERWATSMQAACEDMCRFACGLSCRGDGSGERRAAPPNKLPVVPRQIWAPCRVSPSVRERNRRRLDRRGASGPSPGSSASTGSSTSKKSSGSFGTSRLGALDLEPARSPGSRQRWQEVNGRS